MKFSIPKSGQILGLARKIGYIFQKQNGSEAAFIRPIQGDFPRFHLYVREDKNEYLFNLHLDQKKPTYGEHTAHSGEYEGEVVENEAIRIKLILKAAEKKTETRPENKISEKRSRLADLFKKIFE